MKNPQINSLLKYAYNFLGGLIVLALAFSINVKLTLALFLIVVFIYIRTLRQHLKLKRQEYLYLAFLFVLFLSITQFILQYTQTSTYLIPVASISMLVALLFNNLHLSMVATLVVSIFAGGLAGENIYLAVILFMGGVVSTLCVWRARRRSQIIKAGFIAGLVQVLAVGLIDNFNIAGIKVYGLYAFFNGLISSLFVIGTLPIFEYLFKVVTNISLLELTDFNQPAIKEMMDKAPGTYHHSLIVGHLAEAGADAVGANSLLARVGAYYHDIGKVQKPEYFSENQKDLSPHEQLKASMSKMVIMNHVKDGLDLAKKYRLPSALTDFIGQHHGTSLVYYFYLRALEELEDRDVKEEGFRYPGPKPSTKETAIVLLADSVEAASRVLSEHTPEKIQELVHKIINNKFIDGQLDDCDLTLKDLERISSVFIHILIGIYHSRIEYPALKRSENHIKKSAK